MPIFPVFHHNIGKNTSKSFLKKSIDRKKFSSSNVVSYAKIILKKCIGKFVQIRWGYDASFATCVSQHLLCTFGGQLKLWECEELVTKMVHFV